MGVAVIACLVLVNQPAAQQASVGKGRWNQIIELAEQGLPAFNGEHWQLVEMEHRPYLLDELRANLDKLKAAGGRPKLTPVVRIPLEADETVKSMVKQVLDLGVMGVIVPHVSTREQAMNLVRAMRYPPQRGQKIVEPKGVRGWAPLGATALWSMNNEEYGRRADLWPLNPEGELLAIAMIESGDGIKNIDAILSVPGLGGILIGPSDLSLDLGVGRGPGFPNTAAPEVEAATEKVAKSCVAHKVRLCGTYGSADVKRRLDQGFRLFPGARPKGSQ
jgi:4-hydroxy-2-oxoheptanedioate aldolase